MEIVEEYLLEDVDYKNDGTGGYQGMTINQRYWEELYTGRTYEEYEDYYDYN